MRERIWTLASSIMNVKCLSRWLGREECADRGEVFTYANRQHQRKSNCMRGNSVYIKKNDEGHYELDKEHSYWHQLQGQLH